MPDKVKNINTDNSQDMEKINKELDGSRVCLRKFLLISFVPWIIHRIKRGVKGKEAMINIKTKKKMPS